MSFYLDRLKNCYDKKTNDYELVGGTTSSLLLIRDESAFWQKSRCLVVVVE